MTIPFKGIKTTLTGNGIAVNVISDEPIFLIKITLIGGLKTNLLERKKNISNTPIGLHANLFCD